jgi:putative ABC transport system permease protein
MIPLSYNIRSLKARKASTIATAFGVAMVVAVIAGTAMLINGLNRTLAATGSPDNAIVLRKGADGELSSSIDEETRKDIESVAQTQGAKAVGELVVVVTLPKADEPDQISNVTIRGVTPASMEAHGVKIGGDWKPEGRKAAVGARVLGRFAGLNRGGQVEIKKGVKLEVAGVLEANGSTFESEIWMDLVELQSAFGRPNLLSSMTIHMDSPTKYDGIETRLEKGEEFKNAALDVQREPDYYEKQSEGMAMFIGMIGYVCAFFIALGAMIGAMITMYGSVAQRRREIGTLRALGFGRLSILLSFLLETIFLSIFGGVIGILGAMVLTFFDFSMVNFATWSEIVFTFKATPGILIGAMIAGAGMGLLGGLLPAIRAARTSPLQAMRA